MKDLGVMVRSVRESMKLNLDDGAALCNVGRRFLFDLENGKPTVRFNMALAVAAKFGIQVFAQIDKPQQEEWIEAEGYVLKAPAYDSGHWLPGRLIAIELAGVCGLPLPNLQADSKAETITVSFAPATGRLMQEREHDTIGREEEGGPGFKEIFGRLREKSALPLADIDQVLRWAVFTYLVGDTNIAAGDVYMKQTSEKEWRLACFGPPACIPSIIAAEPSHKGMRIGPSWPEDWLRVDQWKQFAEDADVHPKTVFLIMAELASNVPQAMQKAIQRHYKTNMPRGAAAEIYRAASLRATRMKDLLMAAGHQHQVAGLPKPAPVSRTTAAQSEPYRGDESTYE